MTVYLIFAVAVIAILVGKTYGHHLGSITGGTMPLFRTLFMGGAEGGVKWKKPIATVALWLVLIFTLWLFRKEVPIWSWWHADEKFFWMSQVLLLITAVSWTIGWWTKVISILLLATLLWAAPEKIEEPPPSDNKQHNQASAARNPAEILVTADFPSCFNIPVGPFTIYPIGKEGRVKFIYPDGYVARVGPKERIMRNFEGGEKICVILDDGETTPIRMGLQI
jgi:hypothetical protein